MKEININEKFIDFDGDEIICVKADKDNCYDENGDKCKYYNTDCDEDFVKNTEHIDNKHCIREDENGNKIYVVYLNTNNYGRNN